MPKNNEIKIPNIKKIKVPNGFKKYAVFFSKSILFLTQPFFDAEIK